MPPHLMELLRRLPIFSPAVTHEGSPGGAAFIDLQVGAGIWHAECHLLGVWVLLLGCITYCADAKQVHSEAAACLPTMSQALPRPPLLTFERGVVSE